MYFTCDRPHTCALINDVHILDARMQLGNKFCIRVFGVVDISPIGNHNIDSEAMM